MSSTMTDRERAWREAASIHEAGHYLVASELCLGPEIAVLEGTEAYTRVTVKCDSEARVARAASWKVLLRTQTELSVRAWKTHRS